MKLRFRFHGCLIPAVLVASVLATGSCSEESDEAEEVRGSGSGGKPGTGGTAAGGNTGAMDHDGGSGGQAEPPGGAGGGTVEKGGATSGGTTAGGGGGGASAGGGEDSAGGAMASGGATASGGAGGEGLGGAPGGAGAGGSGGAAGGGGASAGGSGGGAPASVGHRTCDGSAPPALKLTAVATNIGRSPVFITSAPNDASRLFVVDLFGAVNLVTPAGIVEAADFGGEVENGMGEQGFHSIAIHPKFGTGGENRIYLAYNESGGDTRVVQTTMTGDAIDTSDLVGKTIVYEKQLSWNHNGGQLQFGPDGYLYFGFGDGGHRCDAHGNAPNAGSQLLNTVLGKIIRLNVDDLASAPAGNISAANGNDPRILHSGLRNPWRFTFDRGTNDLYIADVGQNAREEINVLPSGSGPTNFGWPAREGTGPSSDSNCSASGPAKPEYFEPIHDYPRNQGKSVTGGYVYRGAAIPGLQGRYLFADYDSNRIWNLTWDGAKMCDFLEISEELDPQGVLDGITSFGEDANGEIYVTVASRTGNGVYRIDPE